MINNIEFLCKLTIHDLKYNINQKNQDLFLKNINDIEDIIHQNNTKLRMGKVLNKFDEDVYYVWIYNKMDNKKIPLFRVNINYIYLINKLYDYEEINNFLSYDRDDNYLGKYFILSSNNKNFFSTLINRYKNFDKDLSTNILIYSPFAIDEKWKEEKDKINQEVINIIKNITKTLLKSQIKFYLLRDLLIFQRKILIDKFFMPMELKKVFKNYIGYLLFFFTLFSLVSYYIVGFFTFLEFTILFLLISTFIFFVLGVFPFIFSVLFYFSFFNFFSKEALTENGFLYNINMLIKNFLDPAKNPFLFILTVIILSFSLYCTFKTYIESERNQRLALRNILLDIVSSSIIQPSSAYKVINLEYFLFDKSFVIHESNLVKFTEKFNEYLMSKLFKKEKFQNIIINSLVNKFVSDFISQTNPINLIKDLFRGG